MVVLLVVTGIAQAEKLTSTDLKEIYLELLPRVSQAAERDFTNPPRLVLTDRLAYQDKLQQQFRTELSLQGVPPEQIDPILSGLSGPDGDTLGLGGP